MAFSDHCREMFYLGTTLLTLCFRPTFLAAKVRTTLFDVCHLFMETDRLPRQARYKHQGKPNGKTAVFVCRNGPSGAPWSGFVSSDFGAINKLVSGHKVVPNISMAISQ